MAIRVKLRIELSLKGHRSKSCNTSALVNTGFESESPECSIPVNFAKRIGLWPVPESASEQIIRSYGGATSVQYVGKAVSVRLVTAGRVSPTIRTSVLITNRDNEVIISDSLAAELGIVIVDPKKGLWIFKDEQMNNPRRSEDIQTW